MGSDFRIESRLKLFEPARQFLVRLQQCADAQESAHDLNIYCHRLLAMEHRREHCHAVFGEGIWEVAATTPTRHREL
jgi:hypothetical protein